MTASVAAVTASVRRSRATTHSSDAAIAGDDAVEQRFDRGASQGALAGAGAACGASRREHIIGVSVSETTAETTTAIVRVSANSRNMRPTRPLMNSSGMNTATSDMVSEITVKPISREPASAASNGVSPSSMWRMMFSTITITSSTTKPALIVSAISERLSRLKPASHITPKVAIRDTGNATPAMIVARDRAQEQQHDEDHQRDAEHQRQLHLVDRGADGAGAVVDELQVGAGGQRAGEPRQLAADAADGLDHVGAGLALDVDDDGRLALVPGADAVVDEAVDDVGDVAAAAPGLPLR